MHIRTASHKELTLAAWHFQIGERLVLDAVCAKLPSIVILHGLLGDSALLTDNFDAMAFCKDLESDGIFITVRRFPATADEYFGQFRKETGNDFNQKGITERQRRRVKAVAYATEWMAREISDEDEGAPKLKRRKKGPMPHLDFAIGIENVLPARRDARTNKEEMYIPEDGVWITSICNVRGEIIADALQKVFAPHHWVHVEENEKRKLRLVHGDHSLFHTGPALNIIADQVKYLRFDPSVVILDEREGSEYLKNFKGKWCVDFSTPRPVVDWEDDEQLLIALHSCVRPSCMGDRTTRSVPREFEDYASPHKLMLARAVRKALQELNDAPESDDVVELSVETKECLTKAAEHHPMTKHIFYEAHVDWDSAIMHQRLIFEPFSAPGKLCQSVSFIDDGSGSTGKGSNRELVETCLGVHNGRDQLGYCCTLNVEALAAKTAEGPSEQKANLFGCSHAFIDDFSPNAPLNNTVLRQVTGGNNLTAARKHAGEVIFKFKGQVILQSNGPWRPVEPFIGADRRRHAGLTFAIKFVDNPTGLNEKKKNSDIKAQCKEYFAEFWFLARVYWLAGRPRSASDRTMPLCPNSAEVIRALMQEGDSADRDIPEASVLKFIEVRLVVYELQLAKPTPATEIDREFTRFLQIEENGGLTVDEPVASRALRQKLFFKAGHTLRPVGTRKKTSVNAYLLNGAMMTLAPAPPAPPSPQP